MCGNAKSHLNPNPNPNPNRTQSLGNRESDLLLSWEILSEDRTTVDASCSPVSLRTCGNVYLFLRHYACSGSHVNVSTTTNALEHGGQSLFSGRTWCLVKVELRHKGSSRAGFTSALINRTNQAPGHRSGESAAAASAVMRAEEPASGMKRGVPVFVCVIFDQCGLTCTGGPQAPVEGKP